MSLHHLLIMTYGAGAASAFPNIEATASTSSSIGVTPRNMSLPAGIQSGELLLLFVTAVDSFTATTPSGWSSLTIGATGDARLYLFYKVADGSEGSAVSIAWTGGATATSAFAFRISSYTGTPYGGTVVSDQTGTTSTADPPSLSPGSSAKYLWIAIAACNQDATISGTPTGYTSRRTGVLNISTKTAEASSENPAALSLSANARWQANTVAVKGT